MNPMQLGDVICDMHGLNFTLLCHRYPAAKPLAQFERGFQWNSVNYGITRDTEWSSDARGDEEDRLYLYLIDTCRRARGMYVNKNLVVIGHTSVFPDEPVAVAAYAYDGRRNGICQIARLG